MSYRLGAIVRADHRPGTMFDMQTCDVENCDRPARGRGWCNMHYQRWYAHGDPLTKLNNRNTPAWKRFFTKITVDDNDCWLWQANVNPKGYAMFRPDGVWQSAHRWIYQTINDVSLSPNEQIDHLCRVRHCVNPRHMDVVDNRTNVIRGNEARGPSTHCKRGHERTPENTYLTKQGTRVCRVCKRAWERKARAEGRKPR